MIVNFSEFKKFFLFSLIGSLIVAALVAVVTVLIGEFNEITAKVLFTLMMVILHSLVSLVFVWDDKRENAFTRLALFINTLFILIVLSFIASIFGIWDILQGETVWRFYGTFFVVGFAALHADILSKTLFKQSYMDNIVFVNYGFMVAVALMMQPIIYIDNAFDGLGEMYFRILGALAIIDATLSILTIIFYRLYAHKHPEEIALASGIVPGQPDQKAKKGLSIWVWIVIIYLLAQVIVPLSYYVFSFM